MESFKSCSGFAGFYEVSNLGRVRSVERVLTFTDSKPPRLLKSKFLKTQKDRRGYVRVRFCVNSVKSSHRIHRLVAEAFVYNSSCPDADQVNHKDGNKTNNCADNLEWVTNAENMEHAIVNGLKADMPFAEQAHAFTGGVTAYKDGCIVTTMYGNADMEKKGFDFRLVSAVLMGKRKSHKGCTFVKLGL